METYNLKATVNVNLTETDGERLERLLSMKGEQPAMKVLCAVFPFVLLGITALLSLVTGFWLKKIVVPVVINTLNKFKETLCPKQAEEIINPLEPI